MVYIRVEWRLAVECCVCCVKEGVRERECVCGGVKEGREGDEYISKRVRVCESGTEERG